MGQFTKEVRTILLNVIIEDQSGTGKIGTLENVRRKWNDQKKVNQWKEQGLKYKMIKRKWNVQKKMERKYLLNSNKNWFVLISMRTNEELKMYLSIKDHSPPLPSIPFLKENFILLKLSFKEQ